MVPLSGCSRPADSGAALEAGQPISAVVSIAPLREVVEALLPEGSEVHVLVPTGASPHGYAPSPSDIARLDRADLVVLVGMGLEGPSASLLDNARPGRSIVFAHIVEDVLAEEMFGQHVCNAVVAPSENAPADAQSKDGHSHGAHASCTHVGDPHLWLDPALMKRLVQGVADHLETRGAAPTPARVTALTDRIEQADREARQVLSEVAGGRLITQHDAWRRFASAYELEVLGSVLPAGVGQPTAGDMKRALDAIEAARAASSLPIAIMTEPQLDPRIAQRVAQSARLPLGMLDPLGEGDWFALHVRNARVIADTLSASSSVAGISPP